MHDLNGIQLLLIAVFAAWWLLGSSWLLQRAVRAKAGLKRQAMGPCILAMFLAGLGAAVVGGLTLLLVIQILETPEDPNRGRFPGAIAAVVLAAPIAILVLYAALKLPLRKLLAVCWPALLSLAVAGVVTGAPAGYMLRAQHNQAASAVLSVRHLNEIDEAIRQYERDFDQQLPADLLLLTVTKGKRSTSSMLLDANYLVCPFLPPADANTVRVGYFYYPCRSVGEREPNFQTCKTLRVCEWTHPHSDQYRSVLLANGLAYPTRDEAFQSLLNLKENAEFARLFRAADANQH